MEGLLGVEKAGTHLGALGLFCVGCLGSGADACGSTATRGVLSLALKDDRVEQCLRSCGSEFQTWGPKQEQMRKPRVLSLYCVRMRASDCVCVCVCACAVATLVDG